MGEYGKREAYKPIMGEGAGVFVSNVIQGRASGQGVRSWKLFSRRTTKREANLPQLLLIFGKWQTSHERTGIVGLIETNETQRRSDGDLQGPDWQERLNLKNLFPAVPTAIEFKLGTDRRFVNLRSAYVWGGLVTSYRVISWQWHHVANNRQRWNWVTVMYLSEISKPIDFKLDTDHLVVDLHLTVVLPHILYKRAHCCSCPKWILRSQLAYSTAALSSWHSLMFQTIALRKE